jgi:hypothetical protein
MILSQILTPSIEKTVALFDIAIDKWNFKPHGRNLKEI